MASITVSGNNASYTLTLSGMSTSYRYHVFREDLDSNGNGTGYWYCIRSDPGTSYSWTYPGSSSSPYSNYARDIRVYRTTQSTGHNGNETKYSEAQVISLMKGSYTGINGSGSYTTYWVPAAQVVVPSFTYYFRILEGLTSYSVYKNGTQALIVSGTSASTLTVKQTDVITVGSSTTTGAPIVTFASGYTSPAYIYFDSDGSFQSTTPTLLSSDHTVGWKNRIRRIQLEGTGQTLTYHFRCLVGVARFTVYKASGGTTLPVLSVNGSADQTLSGVKATDTISVGNVVTNTGYDSPFKAYFGTNSYNTSSWSDLDDDNVIKWNGSARYFQLDATAISMKYRIHAFGNGGTVSSLDDVYRPTSSTWYTADGVIGYFDVSLLPTPYREGYVFNGWSQSSSNTSGYKTGTIQVAASAAGTVNNLYALWTKTPVELFYWDGETGTTDASIISKGQPFGNLTSSRWNRLKAKISELKKALGSSWTYTSVTSGSNFTAAEFNDVRAGIESCAGHTQLPAVNYPGSTIKASYFQSTTAEPNSLKSALNAAITTYNNS